MATSKTMLVAVLDVSSTMNHCVTENLQNVTNNKQKIDIASNFLRNFLLHRMISTKTSEFGLITFGSDKTNNYLNTTQGSGQYENVEELVSVTKPNTNTIVSLSNINTGSLQGDLIDGLVVGQDLLIRTNQKLKFNRVLLLITDGETKIEGIDDLETIATQMINESHIGLYIAMIGKVTEQSSVIKRENAKLLHSLSKSVQGRFIQMENHSDGFKLLSAAPGLCTKPQMTKTILELTPTIKIPCIYWTKNMKAKIPSLKKQAFSDNTSNKSLLMEQTDISTSNNLQVKRETKYLNPDNPELILGQEDKIKGNILYITCILSIYNIYYIYI